MWQENGFLKQAQPDVVASIEQLATLLQFITVQYGKLNSEELLRYPAPGKWSKQELLGHLIDSAMYNLKRFTEAQFIQQPYTIIPYQQNELVAVNQYQHLPITHLLHLWNTLNQQIIFIIKAIPAEMLKYEVVPQYNATGIQTLAWLFCDYVAHMDHHLGPDTWQSFPDTGRD